MCVSSSVNGPFTHSQVHVCECVSSWCRAELRVIFILSLSWWICPVARFDISFERGSFVRRPIELKAGCSCVSHGQGRLSYRTRAYLDVYVSPRKHGSTYKIGLTWKLGYALLSEEWRYPQPRFVWWISRAPPGKIGSFGIRDEIGPLHAWEWAVSERAYRRKTLLRDKKTWLKLDVTKREELMHCQVAYCNENTEIIR